MSARANGPDSPREPTSVAPPVAPRHVDRLATVGLLAAGVVHDLGSSLFVASVHADAIASGDVQGDDARASARLVSQQLERVAARLRRLIDFAHEAPPQRDRVDVASLARDLAELVRPLASKRGVTLRMPPAAPAEARVDELQMEQVIVNLLVNAIQATPEGGVVELKVRTAEEGGARAVHVEVTDDGPGIAPEHRARIFEPFFTTKGTGEGTGLGLSVVDAIVRAHDGRVDVESEAGRGTTFRVSLPSPPEAT